MAMDSDYGEVDKWIATLNECKQLSENEVRKLTELVRASLVLTRWRASARGRY